MQKKKRSNRSQTEMPTHFPDIAARFKEFKLQTGLTYKDLASTLGVTQETLQAYASGRVSPNFHVLRMLKKKFGLNYDWLIDGKATERKKVPLSVKINKINQLLKELEGS